MKILAVDSTAKTATVALCDDRTMLAEFTLNNGNTHSETLLPMIESMLNAFGMKPHDVDLFACSAGPGSFTGVRIGVATVKGLAFGSGRPAVGVSTLEALARNLDFGDDASKIICPVMDARRGQLYTARFVRRGSELERLTPDRAISYTEFENETLPLGKVWLCGDGYGLVHGLMPEGTVYDSRTAEISVGILCRTIGMACIPTRRIRRRRFIASGIPAALTG